MRKYIAVALAVSLGLSATPAQAARGDIWSAKAIRALEALFNASGGLPISTLTTGEVQISGSTAGGTLGSDVVVNGTFTGNATGWTLGGGGGAPDWAYATNNVTHGDSGGTTALQPSAALTVVTGTVYKVQFTVSAYTAGTLTVSIGGTSGSAVAANGTYNYTLTAANTANLLFTPTTTFVGTLDTVTVQTATAGIASLVILDGTTSDYFRVGPASQRNFCIGGATTCQYLSTGSSHNLCIGGLSCETITSGNINVALGAFAGNALTNGTENTFVGVAAGQNVKTGDRDTCVGRNCMANAANHDSNQSTCIGYACLNILAGDGNAVVGYNAGAASGTASYSIALGHGADITASNQLVIGGDDVAAAGITTAYIGRGVTNSTPPATVTVSGTGGSGSNIVGSSITLNPGASTGNGVSALSLGRNLANASGSTIQTQSPAIVICPSKILSNTSATAQTIATITTTSTTAGSVTVDYATTANNGTLQDQDSGVVKVSWGNNAGTVAATMTAVVLQSDQDASGTLATTPTATVATNVVSIKFTPTWVTIVPTTVTGYAVFTIHGVNTVVCQ